MRSDLAAARAIAALLVLQMASSYVVNFVIPEPLTSAAGGLLATAASHPERVGTWVLTGLASSSLHVIVFILAWPVLARNSVRQAVAPLAFSIAGLAVVAVEYIGSLSVLSLSVALAADPAAHRDLYAGLALLARSVRNWAHFTELTFSGVALLFFYGAMLRSRLIPTPLAAVGLLAVGLQLASITRPFFGGEVSFPMLAPLGLCQLALAIWLGLRGFRAAPAALREAPPRAIPS